MSQKQYKNHNDIDKKYKWDLSFLLNGKSPEKAMAAIVEGVKKQIKQKDSKYTSPKLYLKSIKFDEELTEKSFRFHNFISNSISLNVVDPKATKLQQEFSYAMYQLSQDLGPESVRFFENASKIKKWTTLPEFAKYKHSLESSLEEKKYQLPKQIQEFRVKESRADISASEPFSILTNSELDYGFAITSTGKKIKVTPANKIELSKHKDAKVRKTSSIAYKNAFLKHKGTLSNLLFQHKKRESTFSLLEGHKSSIDCLIFGDRVNTTMLETLFSSVQKNKGIFKKYSSAHKSFYKAKFGKTMTKYDRAVELVDVKSNVSIEESIEYVKEAFKPFGKEYMDVVNKAFDTNWVDFMPVDNKRSGAYSIGGTYGIDKKLILMNYDGTLNSTSTLAHEMGHSMHSYFSDKNNNLTNSTYTIFLAEIASIFNEQMLYDHLLSTSDDKKLKFKVLQEMIDGFSGTVMRQVEWANYEYDMYNEIDKGTPLGSYDALSKLYFENSKKYTNKTNPKYKADEQFPAIYVPHFYYGFYVYKYAIGQLVANIFFAKYKQEGEKALKSYINKFLSAGCTKNPLDILKDSGVDLLDPAIYDDGFKIVEKHIKEWITLGKQIF